MTRNRTSRGPGPVAVISAVDFETAWLARQAAERTVLLRRPFPVRRGRFGATECLLMISGVGKINAAAAAAFMIERFRPAALVCLGIGGAYPDTGLQPGQVVFASEEVLPDEGVADAKGRFHPMESPRLRLVPGSRKRRPNRFPVSRQPLTAAEDLLGKQPGRFHAGPFLTVSTATGTDETARQLRKAWAGLCENMEGAAVAQTAERYGIPFFEVRGISNAVGRRNLRLWKKDLAAQNAQQALLHLLESRTWVKALCR